MRTLRRVLSIGLLSVVTLLLGASSLLAKEKCSTFKIHVTPKQAYVYIDDAPAGWGSGRIWALPGEHTLAVYNYGFKPYVGKITVGPGRTPDQTVTLEPIPGNVSGPWGRIQLDSSAKDAAVLLNGTTPDFFVADVHETSSSRRRLLVSPGNYQVTVLNCCGGRQIYSGEVSVAENQATIVSLRGGEKKTVDWKEGSRLTSLPRFQAGGSSDTIAVAKPTAQLSASAGQIACGGTSQLKWTTSDAPRVDLSGVGQVAVNGEQSVQPKQNTSYKLTATGPGGVVTSDAMVNVDSAIQASLTVTPAEIRYHKVGDQVEEGSASISWAAPGADNASLDPFGSVSPTGNRSVQPTPGKTDLGPVDETVTYTLRSSNACGGSSVQTASLHIVGNIESGIKPELKIGNSVYFPTDLPTARKPEGGLVSSQQQILNDLVNNLKQFLQLSPDAKIVIEGHTDKRASAAYNMALSQRRAERVRDFLVSQGINSTNLETKALGKSELLDRATVKDLLQQIPDLTDKDKRRIERQLFTFVLANNRRVDFILTVNGKRSNEFYPYKAPDLRELLREPLHKKAETAGAPAEPKK
jgi:outer membrane protein OmpA-like peptidoglycan-associated protein